METADDENARRHILDLGGAWALEGSDLRVRVKLGEELIIEITDVSSGERAVVSDVTVNTDGIWFEARWLSDAWLTYWRLMSRGEAAERECVAAITHAMTWERDIGERDVLEAQHELPIQRVSGDRVGDVLGVVGLWWSRSSLIHYAIAREGADWKLSAHDSEELIIKDIHDNGKHLFFTVEDASTGSENHLAVVATLDGEIVVEITTVTGLLRL